MEEEEEEGPSKAHTQEEVGKVQRVRSAAPQPSDRGALPEISERLSQVSEKVPQDSQIDRKPQQG